MGAMLTNIKKGQPQHTDPLTADQQQDYTDAVFGNDLIFDSIAEHLNISDLKILRQTSKLQYSKVNKNRKFISNLRLTISDEAIQANGICESIKWKNVSIVVNRTSSQHFQNIQTDCFEDLELLHPTAKESSYENNRLYFYELLEARQFPNLRSMTFDLNLMCYDIPMLAMASVVGTVKEFRFRVARLRVDEFCLGAEEGRIAESNLGMLGGLPWKLHSFAIEGLHLPQHISIAIEAIPASSASSLEELKICSFQLGPKLHGVQFPRLRNISLEIARSNLAYNGVSLSQFLHLQPQLEAVQINCNQLTGDWCFDPALLNAVRSICSSNLHTFRLWGPRWLTSFPDFDSWAFIRDLGGLKNVTICGSYTDSTGHVAANILNCLPSGTQSLELDYVQFDVTVQPRAIAALSGFLHLLELKITYGVGLLNDATLQTICRSLTKLQVFHFWSDKITEFGLTGERDNYNSMISLRNLKSLQDLEMLLYSIWRSDNVSEGGLLKAIQFQELKKLKCDVPITDASLTAIASKNPSLQFVSRRLVRNFKPALDEYHRELFSSILTVNPRLTRIDTVDFLYLTADGYPLLCHLSVRVRKTMKKMRSSSAGVSSYEYNFIYEFNRPY